MFPFDCSIDINVIANKKLNYVITLLIAMNGKKIDNQDLSFDINSVNFIFLFSFSVVKIEIDNFI